MAHPLRTSVEDLIEGLKSFERDYITIDRVRSFVDSHRLTVDELKPYAMFSDKYYTRNLIYRDELFEVMSICWMPGQKTTIHTHNGQLGWMTVPQGEVAMHNFRYVGCNAPENQNVVGIDCLAGATHIEMDRLDTFVAAENSPVVCVDKLHTIHQIENPERSKKGVISLHVYSLPIDSCVAFDLEHQRCYRRTLNYHSKYGVVEVETEQQPGGQLKIIQ
jgi:cysteine dioxygenase